MRKLFAPVVYMFLAGLLVTAAAQELAKAPAQSQKRKKRVAVIDFEYGTVRSASVALFGTDVDVGKGICDLLVKYLVKDGSYTVVERRAPY